MLPLSIIYLSPIYLSSIYIYRLSSIYIHLSSSYYLSIYLSIIYLYIQLSVYLSISALILSLTNTETFTKYTASVELIFLFSYSFTHSPIHQSFIGCLLYGGRIVDTNCMMQSKPDMIPSSVVLSEYIYIYIYFIMWIVIWEMRILPATPASQDCVRIKW